jgi:phage baseplate assembly protein W
MTVVDDFILAETAALVSEQSTPIEPFGFGVDLRLTTDLEARMTETVADSAAGIAEGVIRAWSTPTGSLLDDPDYGFDLIGLLHAGVDLADLPPLAGQLRLAAERDDRILEAAVNLTLSADYKSIAVTCSITPNDLETGDFQFLVAVTSEGLDLTEVITA